MAASSSTAPPRKHRRASNNKRATGCQVKILSDIMVVVNSWVLQAQESKFATEFLNDAIDFLERAAKVVSTHPVCDHEELKALFYKYGVLKSTFNKSGD